MGTSTRYPSAGELTKNEDKPEVAMDELQPAAKAAARQEEREGRHHPTEHDIPAILASIRDTITQARADLAELLRNSRPPNDHP